MDTFSSLCNSSLCSFTLLFTTIYLIGYIILFKNWGSRRHDASSCITSISHGTPAVIMAIHSLLKDQDLTAQMKLTSKNSSFQEMVLEFSIGYFIVDLFHYLIFIPNDVLFIAHHLATLYVLSSCRYVIHHGAFWLLGVLVLAEITSPCQNLWSLARYRKVDVPEAARFHELLSPVFYGFYSLVRGVLGPLYAYNLVLIFERGGGGGGDGGLIPRWAWISWMVVIFSGIGISILWVMNLWIDLARNRANVLKKVGQLESRTLLLAPR